MLHALELALKAALVSKTGREWDTHNVHGPFGQHFRGSIDAATMTRLNRLIQEYGKSRYPDWESPSSQAMESDLEFVGNLVENTVPRLVSEIV
jgi:HEPN domain-containing protein